jgi:hypothetical protein
LRALGTGRESETGAVGIICSCPIAVTNPAAATAGFQIAWPYPCQDSFFKNCASPTAKPKTGATLYVGAPTGSAAFLTHLLTGQDPSINRCSPPASNSGKAGGASNSAG